MTTMPKLDSAEFVRSLLDESPYLNIELRETIHFNDQITDNIYCILWGHRQAVDRVAVEYPSTIRRRTNKVTHWHVKPFVTDVQNADVFELDLKQVIRIEASPDRSNTKWSEVYSVYSGVRQKLP